MAYNLYFEPVGTPKGWADDKAQAELIRTCMVEFDAPVSSVATVANLPEFGAMYGTHPDDGFAQLKKITPRQTEDPSIWIVEFEYARMVNDVRQAQPPMQRPAEVEWETHQFDKARIVDIWGNIHCNSAGDPLVGERQEDSRLVATVSANVTETPRFLLQFRNKINTSPFTLDGIDIDFKCAKIQSIKISGWHREYQQDYRRAIVVIEIREPFNVINGSLGSNNGSKAVIGTAATIISPCQVQGWQHAELDQGFEYILAGKKTPFLDDAGMRCSKEKLLDGNGGKMTYALTAVGSEFYRIYDDYPDVDFSPLNLPSSTS